MEFTKLSAPTLKELFVEELENMIISGELPVGSKLPSERELADKMQISRSVVNSGIADMADKGFLEVIPRSGTYVADFRKQGKIETLLSIMKYNRGSLPDDDILSILQIRKALFTLAIKLAMKIITDEEIETLYECAEKFHSPKDPNEAAELMFKFDHLICCYSGNTLLPLIYYSFKDPLTTLVQRYFSRYGYDQMMYRTDMLCDAFKNKNSEAAIKYMEDAIEDAISGDTTIYN